MRHEPKHQFDCGSCKFNWSCGPLCACWEWIGPLHDVPEERLMEVVQLRRSAGYEGSADELEDRYREQKQKQEAAAGTIPSPQSRT